MQKKHWSVMVSDSITTTLKYIPMILLLSRRKPSEKVFKDVPLDFSNEVILKYLAEEHPHISLRSKVISAKIVDDNNVPTPYMSGDRFLYVESGFDPVLPSDVTLQEMSCRIWHPSQQLKCKRCHDVGHRAHNIDLCPAYITQQDKATIFWRDTDVLSNFYMCHISMFNNQFRSAEHAYQWCKCTYFELYDMAEQVLRSKTPRQAKQTTHAISPEFLSLWNDEKKEVHV